MADDVSVSFGAELTHLTEAVEGIKKQVEGIRTVAETATESLKHLAEIAGVSFSIEGLKAFVEGMAQLGEQTQRTAEIFGITTQEVGQLRFAAESTGGSAEGLVRTLERMSLSLQQATDKSTPVGVALKALGLNAGELSRLQLPEMLDRLRQRFSELPDSIQKTAIAQTLARNGAENLLPVLRLNDEEWNNLRETFRKTGAEMSGATAASFAQTERYITTLKESFEGLGIRIFAIVKPAIDAAIESMTRFVQSIDSATIASALGTLTEQIAGVMAWIGKAALQAYEVIQEAAIRLNYLATYGVQAFNAENRAKMFADLDAMHAGIKTRIDQMDDVVHGFALNIQKYLAIGSLRSQLEALHPDGVPPPGAGAGGGLDLDFSKKTKNPFETGLDQADKALSALRAQVATLNMATAASTAYTEAEKLRAIAETANIHLTASDEATIRAKSAAIGEATQRLQYAKSVQQSLQDLAQGITAAFMSFDGSLGSLGTAFLKLGAQILVAIAQALILDAILAALGLAMPTTGLGAVFSPMFGGGGSGAGAAAGAAMSILPSFAVGAWNLSRDTLAKVHKGETILPTGIAETFRAIMSGGGQSGGDMHFHGPFTSSSEEGDIRDFAVKLKKHVELNPSSRPKY